MRKKKKNNFLTEVELEFMTQLWELGTATVRDVLAKLAPDRNLAYTSGATIMRILEQKNFVTSSKQGKALIYRSLLAKDAYQARSLRNMSEKLFDNAPVALVARLVDDTDLSEEVLAEMRELLDRRLRDNGS
ncbi:MAG: BlaI/MecI/CopY family transcriptional regulator [Rhodobacteraceae bacterium]|nr:BlaI/MecI/CopY family transcriptional regulator [Paracoccaceae bacterium]